MGLTANSDIVSLYLEPQLVLKVNFDYAPAEAIKVTTESYSLVYNVYAEIYITPIKNLEWYFEFEAEISVDTSYNPANLVFNGNTGITWYLPVL